MPQHIQNLRQLMKVIWSNLCSFWSFLIFYMVYVTPHAELIKNVITHKWPLPHSSPMFSLLSILRLTNLFIILVSQPTRITSMWWNFYKTFCYAKWVLWSMAWTSHLYSVSISKKLIYQQTMYLNIYSYFSAQKGSWPTSWKYLQKCKKHTGFLGENIPYLEDGRGGEEINPG